MFTKRKESWFALEICVETGAAEAIEFAFNQLDSLGTEINHLRKENNETVCVVGYFKKMPHEQAVHNELEYALRIYGYSVDVIENSASHCIEDVDWLAEWKKHWKPTKIGRFIIAPPWEPVNEPGKIVINIEPNMAFGTGTHETTQLCIKAIEENYKAGQTFLDVGTGTGILAIVAAKLATDGTEFSENVETASANSVAKILAFDTDVASVAIAKENAALNGAAERIEFYVGSISADTPQFDFVCANLTIDVIVPILPRLIEKTGETLVLSGILQEQEASIVSELRKLKIADYKIESAGEWIVLRLHE